MKNFFYTSLFLVILSCKDSDNNGIPPLSPSEPFGTKYQILLNHYIKVTEYSNGSKFYWIEKGSNKALVIYNENPGAERICCDNGSPFIAFEIDPSLVSFDYSTSVQLQGANSITGLTSSFVGPQSYVLQDGTISGKKLSSREWTVSITLPQKTHSFYNGLNIKEPFRIY